MTHDNASESEVRGLIERWMDAIRANDLALVVEPHNDDVVFYDVPPPEEIRGIEEYRRSWADFLQWLSKTGRFKFNDLQVHAGNEIAFAHGVVTCAGGDGSQPFPVRVTLGLRKVDGRWLIAHEHHSVPATV